MYLIIIGTNRKNSVSNKLAQYYKSLLTEHGHEAQVLDLEQLPADFAFAALYENSGKNVDFSPFQAQIDASNKIVFIAPEYNGSFPGVLKTFIDGLRYPDTFRNKKAALVGLSAGVQGNATGLSHLNDILSYSGCHVLAQRVQLGLIKQHFDGEAFSFAIYKKLIDQQVEALIGF